jgi:hypothetical protein
VPHQQPHQQHSELSPTVQKTTTSQTHMECRKETRQGHMTAHHLCVWKPSVDGLARPCAWEGGKASALELYETAPAPSQCPVNHNALWEWPCAMVRKPIDRKPCTAGIKA